MHRLASGLRRRRVAFTVELGPLARDELAALIARESDAPLCPELVESVCARAEGNPFFAEELIAAALARRARAPAGCSRTRCWRTSSACRPPTRAVVRFAAAAGREVQPAVLTAAMPLGEAEIARGAARGGRPRAARPRPRRRAATGSATPSSPKRRTRRCCRESARTCTGASPGRSPPQGARAGELAEHWIAARRPEEALTASLEAAREAEAVSGLSEALRHLERVLDLWDHVPRAEQVAGVAMPTVLDWAGELAVGRRRVAARGSAWSRRASCTRSPWCSRASRSARRRPSSPAALEGLREANRRMRAAVRDPAAAMLADDDFHARLTANCASEPLLAVLRPVKRALLRYEQVYMSEARRASSARSRSTTRSSGRSSAGTMRKPRSACAATSPAACPTSRTRSKRAEPAHEAPSGATGGAAREQRGRRARARPPRTDTRGRCRARRSPRAASASPPAAAPSR